MRLLIVLLAVAATLSIPARLPAAEGDASEANASGANASQAEGAEERQARVLISSGDVLRGTDLAVTDKAVQVKTPHSGTVAIDRRVVVGITFGPGHDEDIRDAGGERDVLYMTTGDKVSGDILASADASLVVKTFYAGGRESRIPLDKVDYITFAPPSADEALELQPDPVRVILANGDIVGGKLTSFRNGVFRLETQYAGTIEFKADDMHSLHNAAKSRQFFPGGLAEAFMVLFERSGELQRNARSLLPSLTRSLLAQGDYEGALYVLQRMGRYDLDPWTYQQLAEAFEAAKQSDAALICYERMFDQRSRTLHVYRQLYQAYTRHGRYAKAAEVYEELLEQPAGELANYGYKVPQVHMALAETYEKLEDYEKAIGHLRQVVDDASAEPGTRQQARAALVSTFNKIGQLDELIGKYLTQIKGLDDQLGADYLTLVERYIERDKLAKARVQVERLRTLGLDEYAARGQAMIDQAAGTEPGNETDTSTDDEDDDDAE
jgi:tetratricopeptide (TPR) repeat protein